MNSEKQNQLEEEINDIIFNNVNIIEKYELKSKKEKAPKEINNNAPQENKILHLEKIKDYPLKDLKDIQMPTERELRAALNLMPIV
jgi:hypothetical protein